MWVLKIRYNSFAHLLMLLLVILYLVGAISVYFVVFDEYALCDMLLPL
jgi:hypothetical protein